jgi:hypothetical protein
LKWKIVSRIILALLVANMLTLAASAEPNTRIGEVVYSVPVPDVYYPCGLEWDGAALWITSAYMGMIYRFDPFTETILTSFEGPTNYLRDLAWDGVSLWVVSWNWPRNIYRLDPVDGSVMTSFPAPFSGHPNGLAWDGNYLWIGEEDELGGGEAAKIYKVDPSNGQAVYSFSVDIEFSYSPTYDPRGLAWDGEHIWASYQDTGLIKMHDINTGEILVEFIAPFTSPLLRHPAGLAWDGQYLWGIVENYLYRINVVESISACVHVSPSNLNLESRGKWITAYIQLPEDYNPANINASTVMLNGTVAPVLDLHYGFVKDPSGYLVDQNNDGILERMVKFDRASIASWIYQSVGMQHEFSLAITGQLTDGTLFEGTATVFAFWQGHKSPCKR